jgi:8-oxo-dGTP diphosphatase
MGGIPWPPCGPPATPRATPPPRRWRSTSSCSRPATGSRSCWSPETARRKLAETTGFDQPYLEQLATFADPGRDPRGWIPSIAHLALVPPAGRGEWARVADLSPLAFDHARIVEAALDRVRGKLWWSNVAVGILPGAFTLSEARAVYEAIAGVEYDPATFSRDLRATGLIEPTGEVRAEARGRPAALYRFRAHVPRWGAGHRKRVRV